MAAPRILVPAIGPSDRIVTLPDGEAHHVARVLRAAVGDEVSMFDGRGREWIGRVSSVGSGPVTVDVLHETTPAAEPHVRLTLAIGLLKGEQMDTVVRDATMLGVAKIAPLVTAHVAVPSRAWKSTTVIERWRRVAIASAKQCGRAVVPEIAPVVRFAEFAQAGAPVAADSPPREPMLMCVEPRLASSALDRTAAGEKITRPVAATVLVGPEGGWSADELEQARAIGAALIHLGPRTLRAETVPTVVLTALWTAWGW
jgi:16S rRNA (uracil1498-N3)-methyltransferase